MDAAKNLPSKNLDYLEMITMKIKTISLTFCLVVFNLFCSAGADDSSGFLGGALALLGGGQGPSNTSTGALEPGNSAVQDLSLTSGVQMSAAYSSSSAGSTQSYVLGTDEVEVSILNSLGVEVYYKRFSGTIIDISYLPLQTGLFKIKIKNNGTVSRRVVRTSGSGVTFTGNLANINDSAPYKDYILKAIAGFNTYCQLAAAPPAGNYYPMIAVGWGRVGSDKKVTPLSSATVTATVGGTTITLQKLSTALGAVAGGPYGSLSSQQKAAMENWYKYMFAAMYGAAGEIYITQGMGYDCSATFNLGSDPGSTMVDIRIVDATVSPSLDKTLKVKPSVMGKVQMLNPDLSPMTSTFYNFNSCRYSSGTVNYSNFLYSTGGFDQNTLDSGIGIPSVTVSGTTYTPPTPGPSAPGSGSVPPGSWSTLPVLTGISLSTGSISAFPTTLTVTVTATNANGGSVQLFAPSRVGGNYMKQPIFVGLTGSGTLTGSATIQSYMESGT